MVTTVKLSMVWAHTLRTIRSRLYWRVLCRTGVQGEECGQTIQRNVSEFFYCGRTAPSDDLDGPHCVNMRSHERTALLMESGTLSLKELRDDYGMVGDLIVSFLCIMIQTLI